MAANPGVEQPARPSRSFSLRHSLHPTPRLSLPRPKSASRSPPAAAAQQQQSAAVASSSSSSHASSATATASPRITKLKPGSPPRAKSHSGPRGPGSSNYKEDAILSIDALKYGSYFSERTTNPSDDLAFDSQESKLPTTTEQDSTPSAAGQPQITISKFMRPSENMNDTAYQRPALGPVSSNPTLPFIETKRNSVSDAFPTFTRSWNSPNPSRSPSPSSRDDRSSRDEDDSTTASSVSSSSSPTKPNGPGHIADNKPSTKDDPLSGKTGLSHSNTVVKKGRRPLSIFTRSAASEPIVPSVASTNLPQSGSVDSLNALNLGAHTRSFKKVKDELWEAYRLLESDYGRFQSKNSTQKPVIIRQSLLPFLRKFCQKSTYNISPDELDRRVRVLHRWWTGLLAQLRSRNPQAIAGTDRPAYLEGISNIMSRPEWRSAPSTFAPRSQRMAAGAKTNSSTSLSSTSSTYSVHKSVQHNIKVLFTRTLFDTLAFTVEKMGLRTAPPSMVAFGGKVLAYAFYFCTGVGEMLVGLWGVQATTVRRVLPEFGVGRGTDLRGVSESIINEFPEPLHSMGFTTLASTIRQLKKPLKPPIGAQIEWHGPWISRWCGRDTDLLFVFLKHYQILLCDYLPSDVSAAARLCAPGYVMVQAQILTMLDSTIHRQPAVPGAGDPSTSTTFDDMLSNATAALTVPTRNQPRTISENKLVVLLRDLLSDKNIVSEHCRELYLVSFVAMLKAAVRRTRLYDANACFTLCDLMEEILPILSCAEKHSDQSFVDWPFWIDVAKRMFESENNMTELRLISFLYSSWDILAEDDIRKRSISLDWLLSLPIWERFFCHWCPMVRAYWMRLVCWRVGRYDGDATPLNQEILETLSLRLRTGYAHYIRLLEKAEKTKCPPPSTAPCLPAPSRRLVILRNDTVAITPQGAFLDGIIPNSAPVPNQSLTRSFSSTSLASLAEVDSSVSDSSADSAEANTPPTSAVSRRWSQIRSALSFRSAAADSSKDSSNSSSPQSSPESTPTKRRASMSSANNNQKRNASPPPAVAAATPPPPPPPPEIMATFKFSLEWMERPPFGGRDRLLRPARLPATAQKYLQASAEEPPSIEILEIDAAKKHWTYVGRALAEWILVIVEYENFFDRRKMEGRETDKAVETPSLAVDSMRKF